MKTETIRIGGMTCVNCQNRVEQALKSAAGIYDAVVDFNTGTARVTYDEAAVTRDGIAGLIKKAGYSAGDGEHTPALKTAGTLVIIIALYMLLRGPGLSVVSRVFPAAEAGAGFGMLFVTGLLTSLHCAAMCGGINLSQCLGGAPEAPARRRRQALLPAILYNGGRVVSYTLTGAAVGALGSVISVSGTMAGAAVQLAAGVFMVIMGLNMLGLFPALRRFTPRLPKIFARKMSGGAGGKGPLVIGLLNGFMPCGPLQAMQLYALSTGNIFAGAFSMFLFGMGTVPLMFAMGAIGSFLNNTARGPEFARRVTRAGAVLITVMGMAMFGYGVNLSGLSFDFPAGAVFAAERSGASFRTAKNAEREGAGFTPDIENGVQIVNSTLSGGRYPAITVQRGIPARWTINAPAGSINGCNNRMIIREYGIEYRFKPGENVIEFTPERAGKFVYSCWMGMIRSSITVLDSGETLADAAVEDDILPVPAGVAISAETVLLAERAGDGSYQTITMALGDDGMEPAVLVVQRGLPAVWTINNDSLDPGNSGLVFPAYYARIEIGQGENVIRLMPADDFDFSTSDHVFYGFVKVVDDLSVVDIEAVRSEAAEYETLIYPDAYFEASFGSGCCAAAYPKPP